MDFIHNKINLEVSVKINLVLVDNKVDLLVDSVLDKVNKVDSSVVKVKDNKEDSVVDLVDKVKDNKEDLVLDSVDKVKDNKEDLVLDLGVKYQEFHQFSNLFKDLYMF